MFQIDKQNSIPLYRQLMNEIIIQIKDEELQKGERLPSERILAKEVGVNRSTVVRTYDELDAQGFVERRPNSGTYVLGTQSESFSIKKMNTTIFSSIHQSEKITQFYSDIRKAIHTNSDKLIDTYTGELPSELIPNIDLPQLKWQEFLNERNDSLGYYPLRQEIRQLMNEGIETEIMLTAGGQQSLFLLLQVLLKPGDTVAIEAPSFFNGLSLLQSMAINIIEIPVDSDGMKVAYLEEKMEKETIQLVLTNPNFQNPTGSSMTLKRRKQLVSLCQLYRIPIIEDDVFGQLFYKENSSLPRLKSLAPKQVIYLGSLSKVLGKEIQLGWIEASKKVLDQVKKLRDESESQLSIFPQVLAAHALQSETFKEELIELRTHLLALKSLFIETLEQQLKGEFTYINPQGGYYIWLTYRGRKLMETDWYYFLEKGILIFPSFFISSDVQSCRINLSRLDNKSIPEFISRLSEIVEIWQSE
ncbi:MAG: PLP-dependent aminotransferase family protein [Vagococcus sp.]|uniref:aminotransferase-like domain-containing protein n=1 Tax=Vagococcus TaxID=2737 RepID=UPI002FC8FAC8